jgi:cell division protein FtsA
MKTFLRSCQVGIDLGSSKVCCWIGHNPDSKELPTILGMGHVAAKGLWAGNISDVRALEHVLTAALYEAEQQAKVQIRYATISLNGAFFSSNYGLFQTSISETVTHHDVNMLLKQIVHPHFSPIHIIPLEFCVDQQKNIQDPIGVVGKNLVGKFHILWMQNSYLKTLLNCFKRCQLRISDIVASGYSCSFSCLLPDEQELGVTLIDMGASNTQICVFNRGKMVSFHTIPLGGNHITQDIAQGCDISLSQAERIKTLYGSALVSLKDQQEMIPIQTMGQDTSQISRSFLASIAQARCKEIITHIEKYMQSIPHKSATQRVVLTGGASQLSGLRELIQRQLDCSVRVAKPILLPKASYQGEEFSAITGTFLYTKPSSILHSNKRLSTFFSWLKKKL